MDMTMVQLRKSTVEKLKKQKRYPRQTYDEVVMLNCLPKHKSSWQNWTSMTARRLQKSLTVSEKTLFLFLNT